MKIEATFFLLSFLGVLSIFDLEPPCLTDQNALNIYQSIYETIGRGYEYNPAESLTERLTRCQLAINTAFVNHLANDGLGIPKLYIAQIGTFIGTDEIFDYFCLQTEPRITGNWYVPLNTFGVTNVTGNAQCVAFAATVQSTGFYILPLTSTPPLLIRTFIRGQFQNNKLVTLDIYYEEFFVFLAWLSELQKSTNHLATNAEWCSYINTNCASTLTGYCTPTASVPNCVNCTAFFNGLSSNSPVPGNSNSTTCRDIHAAMTSPLGEAFDPLANQRHCSHAGHSGGGICVPPY